MSLPNFPNITPRISITLGQAAPLLLGSIALEELALAHVINAEAEKIQFVLGTLTPSRPLTPPTVTISNLLAINKDVRRTLQDVIKKEMLLQFKFENILDLIGETGGGAGVPCNCTIVALNLTGLLNGLPVVVSIVGANLVVTVEGDIVLIIPVAPFISCENGSITLSIPGVLEITVPAITATIDVATSIMIGDNTVALDGTVTTECA